jgi:hypothetical protein
MQFDTFLYSVSLWVLPVVLAVTLHEAAHGFAAHRLGDDTAHRLDTLKIGMIWHFECSGKIFMYQSAVLMVRS